MRLPIGASGDMRQCLTEHLPKLIRTKVRTSFLLRKAVSLVLRSSFNVKRPSSSDTTAAAMLPLLGLFLR